MDDLGGALAGCCAALDYGFFLWVVAFGVEVEDCVAHAFEGDCLVGWVGGFVIVVVYFWGCQRDGERWAWGGGWMYT